MMDEDKRTDYVNYCMVALYPEYFTVLDAKKKTEILGKLLDEIYELGLQELVNRIIFMRDHEEGKE